ncbi:Enoyl-CoA hydratase/isomerase (plasmid) [Rhizobium leguminosarum bv. trifolii WSM2304]|uniref:Enoyl-CoA hydratase/isomerase n=1 Tax=Rhizobium leguminosarum bv. trifolii (strain WSM2304) TaxID=395492 RepID=A0ABF7QZW3_RHILW|nr:enoyl-CoA hydratase/isomerase family protein [Rhizobium leguminosarum]ACI59690.1 Enoyl-CoA hydratase/isomerase [Rhizobium leguminosarum bv. trifolii WSM2304]
MDETLENAEVVLSMGKVATLEINRPEKRNAVHSEMWKSLLAACERIGGNPDTRVLLLKGRGLHFCGGADISEFSNAYASDASAERYNSHYAAIETALRHLPFPVIAEIRGACFGGGLGLALSADFRFCDTTAMFAVTASKLGIAYSPEDTARVIEKIGPARAKDLLFSARTVMADEALAWNLVDRVFAAEELEAAVEQYAHTLVTRSKASLRAIKTIVNKLAEPGQVLCDSLRPTYSELFRGSDIKEGARAFMAKREPNFE